jgi:hypothetical protein
MAKTKQSKEIGEGIFLIDKAKSDNLSNNKIIIFTILGSHKSLDDGYPILTNQDEESDLAFAKRETVNGKENYFIKTDDENSLYNPISSSPSNRDHKFKVLKNQPKSWQFSKVNAECFNQYITFLKTKNLLYLKYANRIR